MNGYTLTFGGLLLLGGRAGDILGRRRMFLAGIAVFTLASLAGGLATTASLLLAARAVQGVGAALAYAFIRAAFDGWGDRLGIARSWQEPCSSSPSAFGLAAIFDVAAFVVIALLLRPRKPAVPDTPAALAEEALKAGVLED